ncbi:gamma-glutamyltransferase [Mesorhizobium sp. M3A.F.Ca.ET.174.01.1.1]|uniref:gamma-glutamyltransferase n=1 Tax=unclassified Mesorhizobium TaxID=325217 RepID=UPI001093EE53|nr:MULTISPECIES: gamma-glutamyltransferase [unclassified Mesorhizobium]TGS82092.1 gamma-glutamyltransferase [Mesorhizobium sp. M3A.F.Ca.ET.175.01.1.1]TGT21954.1 gamma-glutamyltransferase [Mesorhizobium sp. M3A.F.Ca.ET.174.01.1.1]
MRDFHFPGRSPVRATEAMAATSHPLATLAAIDMQRSGGNAMDAAVCAAAVQAVVEPQSTGIGGDCFVLYCPKGEGDVIAFNGSGRAPNAATVDWYLEKGFGELPKQGPHAVTIPGAVDAWCRLLEDHGRKGMAEALAPAIHYAENGYVVHDRVAFDWEDPETDLSADEVAARIFLPGGKAPRAGDVHRQPELAEALRIIARKGRAGFYEGEVAEDLVGRLRALGGLHTLDDFAATRGEYKTAISTSYDGYDIHQMPPNNQGLTALLMLNVLSGFDLGALDPNGAERLHLEIEAGRLAYRDRDDLLADQDHVAVPVKALLSSAYAGRLRAAIDPERAMTGLPRLELPGSDTVYITVVDRDLNAVSFINSTYYSFGSGVVGPKTGIVLQNRGTSFRLDPRHPNAIAPGKRPMHTIMPGMMTKDGRAVMPFGVMGGGYQPFGHVHLLTNMIDFGMDPQQALDAPRVFYNHDTVEAERSVRADAVEGLRRRGHQVVEADHPLGGGQAVLIDWEKGTLTGASDLRKDGLALGY